MVTKLLEELCSIINADLSLPSTVSKGEEFEDYILGKLEELLHHSSLNLKSVVHNGTHSFPDLKITTTDNKIYGIEVKFSASGNWNSKGNSVFESLSDKRGESEEGYQDIFVLFGRKPKVKESLNTYEVKYAPYGQTIDRIEVTHSPRFSINMNTSDDNLFDSLGYEGGYAKFRLLDNQAKNQFLRDYFNKLTTTNEADKWYVDNSSSSNTSNSELAIQAIPFTSLALNKRRLILAESFILFPRDLFKNKANYSNVIHYMITNHLVYSSSIRDSFSSGGKELIIDESIKYPQMLKTFFELQDIIKFILRNPAEDFERECFISWGKTFGEDFVNEDETLEENYERIIKTFQPVMEIESGTGQCEKVSINLAHFYKFDQR